MSLEPMNQVKPGGTYKPIGEGPPPYLTDKVKEAIDAVMDTLGAVLPEHPSDPARSYKSARGNVPAMMNQVREIAREAWVAGTGPGVQPQDGKVEPPIGRGDPPYLSADVKEKIREVGDLLGVLLPPGGDAERQIRSVYENLGALRSLLENVALEAWNLAQAPGEPLVVPMGTAQAKQAVTGPADKPTLGEGIKPLR